jgi:hypothetical protein
MKDFKKHEARLLDSFAVNGRTTLMTFRVEKSFTTSEDPHAHDGQTVGFSPRGGQYVILDTGIEGTDGKPLKRAYSLLSPCFTKERMASIDPTANPSSEAFFSLAVFRLGESSATTSGTLSRGLGSLTLSQADKGRVFKLTGPWGRLTPEHGGEWISLPAESGSGEPQSMSQVKEDKTPQLIPGGSVSLETTPQPQDRLLMVVAAGTGITGGLNLFSHRGTTEAYGGGHLLWIDDGQFLTQGMVRELLTLAASGDRSEKGEPAQEGKGFGKHFLPTQADFTIVSPENLQKIKENFSHILSEITLATFNSHDGKSPKDIVLDMVFFGDGTFFNPMMDELVRCVSERRLLERIAPLQVKVQVKKEFYYHRPTTAEGTSRLRQGGAGESRGAPGNI